MPKINSVHYGGIWIGCALIIGLVIPSIVWMVTGMIIWWLIILGAIAMLAFIILFMLEMHQDSSKVPHYEKGLKDRIPYDPETQTAIIRSSICNGEKVAGFKNRSDGHFTEVMLIRSPEEEQRFKEIYGLDEVKIDYFT